MNPSGGSNLNVANSIPSPETVGSPESLILIASLFCISAYKLPALPDVILVETSATIIKLFLIPEATALFAVSMISSCA